MVGRQPIFFCLISITTIQNNYLFLEFRVTGAFITKRDSREKNLRRTSGSFSGERLASKTGIMSSNISPTTGPVVESQTRKSVHRYSLFNDTNSNTIHL